VRDLKVAISSILVTVVAGISTRLLHCLFEEELNQLLEELLIVPPVAYKDIRVLERHEQVVLTDSGGVQKEACILRVPCVTLRQETEWEETVRMGWNLLAGADKESILRAVEQFSDFISLSPQVVLYGVGDASKRIVEIIAAFLGGTGI